MSTTDALIGERIHQIMWRQRMTQGQLAARLGLTQTGVSRKIRGERPWFARELLEVAKALNTQVSALLPSPGDFDPPVVSLPRLDSDQQPFDHCSVDVA
jgi:transcriptional regulator with XRE-family HTH domain